MSNEDADSTFVLNPVELLSRLRAINNSIMGSAEFNNLDIATTSHSVGIDMENGKTQAVEFYNISHPISDEPLTRVAYAAMPLGGDMTAGFIVDSPISGFSYHRFTGEANENGVEACLTGLYTEVTMILLFKLVDSKVLIDK